ncbi:MAG: MmcQ/YjbR family DNA-binding protein [Pseudomonadales bacterium]|jgi:hypothetical protein|nr:MmcQ/YjbR family DNA-binding protein [Pseudomonadales bacterium]
MAKQHPGAAVAALCEALPEVEAATSHGMPIWKAGGRQFATFSLNHHGDGHVGLLLKLPSGESHRLVDSDPEVYYIPAYSGPSGWVGVELNSGVAWQDVIALTVEAWRGVVAATLARSLAATPEVPAPRRLKAGEIDPFVGARGRKLLDGLRRICLALPETTEDRQWGAPCFRVGRKNFATLFGRPGDGGGFSLQTWVGPDRQAMLTFEERYRIPAYSGRNGWIELGLDDGGDWREIEGLVLESYRRFATRRALKALDGG